MEFKYYIEYIGKSPDFILEPNNEVKGYINNVGGWLHCDVQGAGRDYFLPIFDKVLCGMSEEEIISGNAYEAVIHKDYTTISYDFEYCNPEMVPCIIPTKMLYEILQIWIKVCEEQRAKEN